MFSAITDLHHRQRTAANTYPLSHQEKGLFYICGMWDRHSSRSLSYQPPQPPFPPSVHRAMASSSTSQTSQATGYVCDTLPAARLAKSSHYSRSPSPVPPPTPPTTSFQAPILNSSLLNPTPSQEHAHDTQGASQLTATPGRKLCVRHQRMADEGTNLKLQQVSTVPAATPQSVGARRKAGLPMITQPGRI